MENYKIGIAGLGIVGSSIKNFLEHNHIQNTYFYDKFKKNISDFDVLLKCDIIFLCLPTKYKHSIKDYDYSAIDDVMTKLKKNKYDGLVVLKSTITPGKTIELYKKYNLDLCFYPEFLTASTANIDFLKQKQIILGLLENPNTNLKNKYNKLIQFFNIYFNKSIITITNTKIAESVKLFCNNFYSMKIGICNDFYKICEFNNIEYDNVMNIMLNNGWINKMHTKVPGTDTKFGYGGGCFIKDTNALNEYMKRNNINSKVLDSIITLNNERRDLSNEYTNCID